MTNQPFDAERDQAAKEHEEALQRIEERRAHSRPGLAVFLGTAGLLAALLGALALYTYSVATRPDSSPERITALEHTVGVVNQDTNNRLSSWNQDRDQLRQQIEQTGSDLLRRFDLAKKQTGESFEAMSRKLRADVEQSIGGLSAKVDGLETSRGADQAQVASLKQELTHVQGELDKQARELAVTRERLDTVNANAERQLAAVKDNTQRVQETAMRTRQDFDSLNNKLAVDRIDFEIAKGHVRQITPEISINVTGIDLAYHRIDGWMWVMPDRRTVWLRKASTAEPVTFYGHDDGKKRELVLTGLTKNSVNGYLLLPKGSTTTAAVAAAN